MFSFFLPRLAVLILVTISTVVAQVPQLLNYQGRVRVSGADFTGTGQLKFAMVSSTGSTTFWSNDGTSIAGSQPAAAVSLLVQGGLYQIMLGDATVPNMTALPTSVFSNSGVSLRVWFSDGVNGWQQLTPDQRVAAVGYAMIADSVRDGAITAVKIADSAVTAAKLSPGAVTASALAPTAVVDSLAASGSGTVPSGASLISPLQNAPAILAAGYVSSGRISAGDSWVPIVGATARDGAASVWTGTEFLLWGDGPSGWRYNPTSNIWTAMSTLDQPTNREECVAVWTGTEMLVWGGVVNTTPATYPTTGGRYNPATNSWTSFTNTNAPPGRKWGPAVWTGEEMIVWGGAGVNDNVLEDGARYNPSAGSNGTWSTLPTAGAPIYRYYHSAVWLNGQMIVFGGRTGTAPLADGARYTPSASGGTWSALATGPSARFLHTAVSTGSSMLVWGGGGLSGTATFVLNTGNLYNPITNTWSTIPTGGAPEARFFHTAVWSGKEMIVWGGSNLFARPYNAISSGGRYNPTSNTWEPTDYVSAPPARYRHQAVWTGTEMLIWGGLNGASLDSGGRYLSGKTLYLYQRP